MSWSYSITGHVKTLIEKIEALDYNLVLEEHESFLAVKSALLKELSILKPQQVVTIEADGSMWKGDESKNSPPSVQSSHKLRTMYFEE